jgi:hypothetical protein
VVEQGERLLIGFCQAIAPSLKRRFSGFLHKRIFP